jgi:hypothetical protein
LPGWSNASPDTIIGDMLTRLARVFLAAVLLAGWQSALVHPLVHLDNHGGFVHLADGHEQQKQKKSDPSGLCDVLAALAACLSGAPKLVAPVSSSQQVPQHSSDVLRIAEAPPFLSRGPPTVL